MNPARAFVITLRRPGKNDLRSDPFWEFGSFGCTGCHGTNLLHPKNCKIGDGDRLAFVQGGNRGARLLLVTPPVTRIDHPGGGPNGTVELRWDRAAQPFKYREAPSLFATPAPGREGRFPKLHEFVRLIQRPTLDGKFASRFRSRSKPLEPHLAEELIAGFEDAVRAAASSQFVAHYHEALPWYRVTPETRGERKRRYQREIRAIGAAKCPQ